MNSGDTVAMCNDIESTKKVYTNGETTFRFHNLTTNESLYFYNCKEFIKPVDNSCDMPEPKAAVCEEPQSKADKSDKKENKKKAKDDKDKKSPKPNPFEKPKNEKPKPDMTCKI
ncbi:hypothetical protein HI145_RS01555 [Escherichia coli]|nr:hypothetical protein [Escherichia coli]